jgi:hypothetical protein
MAPIPVRLPPLPGEALDSWLEAYAHLLHVSVRDIFAFAGMDWGRVNGDQRADKPWLCQLGEPDLAALGAVIGVAPETLAGMTLARYQGTGLAEATAPPGIRRTPRWWRQLSGSRYCPRCLAANGGRWMLAWRIPWAFACTGCQVLLPAPAPAAAGGTCAPAPGSPARPAAATSPACPCRHGTRRAAPPPPAPATPPARQPPRCPPAGTCWPPSSTSTPSSPRCSPHEAGQRKQPPCSSTWTTPARSPAPPSQPSTGQPAPGRCHRGPGRTRRANRTRRCHQRARQPLGRAAPAARARHRVRRHHRRHHAARPAPRPRPRHRRVARREHRQPPQHHQPGGRARPLGPGQPRPAGRPGQAARVPAGQLPPAALPRHRRTRPYPRPHPR